MPIMRDLYFRIRTLFGVSAAERELDAEFAFHLEMERDKLIASGMSPAEAAVEAARRFGGATRERQRTRDQWGIGLMRDLASDVRHALRQLKRRPAYGVVGTLTLALGIGATVSLFSVVRGTLLRPLPVTDEARLHVFWQDWNWRGVEFDFLKPRARAFSGLAAYTMNGYTLGSTGGNITVLSADVSAELFDVIGRTAELGRTFRAGEDRPGAEPTVILSWSLWQQEFGGDEGILGRRVTIGGSPLTVIGVMPREFYFPTPEVQMWRTLDLDPASGVYQGNGWLVLLGRANATASAADVQTDIQAMAAALGKEYTYPDAWDKSKNAHTTLLREYAMGSVRSALLLLMGAVVALLLMACANVAALVLGRTTDRTPEMALRAALGAGRGRLVRQIVAESLVLSTIAGVVGVAIAAASFGTIVNSLPLRDGLGTTLAVDWAMLASAIGIAAVVGLIVAAVPARSLLFGDLRGISGERSSPLLRGRNRGFHSTMVTAEIALGVILAAGSLLLVRSVSHIYSTDAGFDPAGVVAMDLVLPPSEMEPAVRGQFYRDVVGAVNRIPGIDHAALVSRFPIRDGGGQATVRSPARPDLAGPNAPNSYGRSVSVNYFDAMGIRIVKGRAFTDADRLGSLPVAIVSQSFADRMWPSQDPIGQQVSSGMWGSGYVMTVVGVTAEARLFRMIGDNPLGLYRPVEQARTPPEGYVLVAKTTGETGAAIGAMRSAVRALDRRAAIGRVGSMESVIANSIGDQLRLRLFLTLFAALALVLGSIGVYGVASYAVTRRRAEFGVRMALGATSGRVLGDVLRDGVRPVMLGVAIGVVATIPLSRAVRSFLYDVQPTDLLSLSGAAGALLVTGLLAVLVPAMRAGRTSPVEVLRGE